MHQSFVSRVVALLTALLTAGLLIPTYASPCETAFLPAVNYPVGDQDAPAASLSSSLAAADLDLDDDLDLILSNLRTDDLSILFNNDDGTFAPEVRLPSGSSPAAVRAADLDGDDNPDLIIRYCGSARVGVWLGNGDGTFGPEASFTTGNCDDGVVRVAIGDFDGDLLLDLAVPNEESDDVSVLLGNGDGTFNPETRYSAGVGPYDVVAVDLDGDLILDLAVANSGGFFTIGDDDDVSILLGNGSGGFVPAAPITVGDRPMMLATGDYNEDGNADLASVNWFTQDISLLLGNGDGTFAPQQRFFVGSSLQALTTSTIDLNPSSDLVAVGNIGLTTAGVALFRGNGDGTFESSEPHPTAFGPVAIVAEDLDLDGLIDLAVVNTVANELSVLLNRGTEALNVRFTTDKTTLSWLPLNGAISYNAYRGDLTALTDANEDDLPDGGYGSCQNMSDADLSDTEFVDTSTPLHGAGFFYLFGAVTLDGERALGTTAGCLQRQAQPPCP